MIRAVAVAVACLATSQFAFAQVIPKDQDGFTDFVAQRVRKEVSDTSVVIRGPLTLGVGDLQANLDRIYAFCGANASDCVAEMDLYVKGIAQVLREQNAPPKRESVRLAVRTTKYVEATRASLPAESQASQLLHRPLAPGLVVLPVIDSPRTIMMMSEEQVRSLDITLAEAFALGLANLKTELKPLMEVAKAAAPGQIGRIVGDSYTSSRLIMIESWEPLAKAQGGVLIASAPATNAIFYLAEDTPAAIDALRTLARDVMGKAPNRLADTLLRWKPSGWEVVQ